MVGINTDRGFTNHEHLEELGLIHMNGRVYDPALGRFMSADPKIPDPGNIQSFNRYEYVFNQPLIWVDASGYDVFSGSSGGGGSYYGGGGADWNGGFFNPQGPPAYRGNAPSSSKPAAAPTPAPAAKPVVSTTSSPVFSTNAATMASAMNVFSQATSLFVDSVAGSANSGSGEGAKLIRDCASEVCVVGGVRYKSSLDILGNAPVPLIGADGRQVLDSAGQALFGPSRANLDKVTKSLQSDIGNATKFRQGGDWDFQRVKDDNGNYIFTKQYREFANVAIGYAFAGKGIGWWGTAAIADVYAWKNSTFGSEPRDSVFRHLPTALTYDYSTGANLWVKNANVKNPPAENNSLGQ